LRPLLEKFVTSSEARGSMQSVIFLAIVLAFASGWITERIGIHAFFGAFAAGVIFPKNQRLVREVNDKVGFLAGLLFLPPYFALTGMRTRIPLMHDSRMWAYFSAILVVAVVGKFGGAFMSARLSKAYSLRESAALGILLNTRGLVELIVLNIGLEAGVISTGLFSILVLMAIFTTIATTPLLDAVYPATLYSLKNKSF
jgi:Kef-type K+ transport system membrane component KefB